MDDKELCGHSEQLDDNISRQEALRIFEEHCYPVRYDHNSIDKGMTLPGIVEVLNMTPPAQPEVRPIDYQDCSNAMLKMWMDNVVTDGEYNRIMDKLNAHWGKKDG